MKEEKAVEEIVEIKGTEVVLKRGEEALLKVPLAEFVATLSQLQGHSIFPDGSPLNDGVRYVYARGSSTIVVVELDAGVRQIQWISPDSPLPFGGGTRYARVSLGFPFIVVVILFLNGRLSGTQQLFYRKNRITSENDALYFPNLLNVSRGYGQPCWLCLAGMKDVSQMTWNGKIQAVIDHFWDAGFNRSSEHHEGNSYWQTSHKIDRRLRSIDTWSKATAKDPFFMLKVGLKPAGVTIRQAVDSMFSKGHAPLPVTTVSDLIQPLCSIKAKSDSRPLKRPTRIRQLLINTFGEK